MVAANARTAAVLGAGVLIVAIQKPGKAAFALSTQVTDGTCVAIVAGRLVGHKDTSRLTITAIVGAHIAVVAEQHRATDTFPSSTRITCRTCITVVAGDNVILVLAALRRITAIVSTRIVVGAKGRRAGGTDSGNAGIADGAGIAVAAGQTFVGSHHAAGPGNGVTGRGQTEGIRRRRRRRTLHHRLGSDLALVRQGAGITGQSPIAQVPILQNGTVGVDLAVTRYRDTATLGFMALVRHGTGIAIITNHGVRRKSTAAQTVAGVIGARVFIVAINGRTHADSGLTMVPNGAGILVPALALFQRGVLTPGFA